VSNGKVIFGASMSHLGTFGWCEYAPAVPVECPHCCPQQLESSRPAALLSKDVTRSQQGLATSHLKGLSAAGGVTARQLVTVGIMKNRSLHIFILNLRHGTITGELLRRFNGSPME